VSDTPRAHRYWLLALVAMSPAACVLGGVEFEGKSCQSAADCPRPFSCIRRPDGERACYLSEPDFDYDASVIVEVPEVTPDYCHDAKPVLDQFCLSACHGPETTGSGRADFRLDYYDIPGNPVLGAKSKASAIRVRTYVSKDMPPPGLAAPSEEQRKLLADWAQGGAIECRPDAGI
jgi:hypothetical protein